MDGGGAVCTVANAVIHPRLGRGLQQTEQPHPYRLELAQLSPAKRLAYPAGASSSWGHLYSPQTTSPPDRIWR